MIGTSILLYYLCIILYPSNYLYVGGESSVGTGWKDRGSNLGWGEIFHTRTDRLWSPPSLLYKV